MRKQIDECIHHVRIEVDCKQCEQETLYGCGRMIEMSDAEILDAMKTVFAGGDGPRVITRVMSDGVQTKDGAA